MRVSMIGPSGSGKTTFGRKLAASLDVPFLGLDEIVHRHRSTELTDDQFRKYVAEVVCADGWVVDGRRPAVAPLIYARATDLLWFDFSKRVVMLRNFRRSARKRLTRREPWSDSSAWTSIQRRRMEYEVRFEKGRQSAVSAMDNMATAPEFAHLRVTHFRTPREAAAWLDSVRR